MGLYLESIVSEQQSQALVLPGSGRPIRFRLARSLKAATVGEVMALDERGDVVDPKRSRLQGARLWLGATAIGGLGWASVATLGGAAFLGPAFLVGCLGLMAWESRRLGELKRAIALAAAGRRDEAAAAFAALEGRRAAPPLRATIDYWLGSLAWQKGDLVEAERRLEAALAVTASSRRLDVLRWIIEFSRAQLFAVKGEIEKAKRVRAELEAAPDGEYFRLARMLTDLTIAFHRDSPDGLPDDLHEWAREALEMNRFGHGLVLLSWAYAARGDQDMAAHLLREAPDRLEASFLPESDPALNTWMEGKRVAWNLDADEYDRLDPSG
jgi:tetratricopeptide (TPR) repeat protein